MLADLTSVGYWLFGIVPLLGIILVTWLAGSSSRASRRPPVRLGDERSHETEADIENEDIDQMLRARNDIRRRAGKPLIGDELVEELRRGWSEDPHSDGPPPRAER